MTKTSRRIIRSKKVEKRTGYSRMQVWRKSRDPEDDFPAPVKLSANGATGWYDDEIDQWLASRPRLTSVLVEPEAT